MKEKLKNKAFIQLLVVFLSSQFFTSCSMIQKKALQSVAPVMLEASNNLETQGNWDYVDKGLPAQLLLLESLWSVVPDDEDYLHLLIKGHTAMAFVVEETKHYEEQLKDSGNETNAERAIFYYNKAIKFSERYLKNKGISLSELLKVSLDEKKFYNFLDDRIGESDLDVEAMFFIGLAYSGLINLQRQRADLLGQLTSAKNMVYWSCSKKDDLAYGGCYLYKGMYESSRPAMMGGNPKLAKKIFLDGIEKFPNNLMLRIGYMQNYLIPREKEEDYKKQKDFLKTGFDRFLENVFNWKLMDREEKGEKEDLNDFRVNIYNGMAYERFKFILKYEGDFF